MVWRNPFSILISRIDSVIGLKVNTSGDVEMVKTIATTAGITAAGFTELSW